MVPDAQLPRIPRRNRSQAAAAATPFLGWKQPRGDPVAPVSARKLGASLWQLAAASPAGGSIRWQCGLSFDRLGFQFCSSLPLYNLEGSTKWDSCDSKAWHCADDFHSNVKLSLPALLAKQAEPFKSRKHVNEVETKMKYPMRKIDQETIRTQHHLMMCSAINNLAKGVRTERRICKNIDKMNTALLRDIADAKSSATKLIRSVQNEKKAREELEDACYDLAREIEARKAEIWALRDQQERIQLEVEEERKMLQMAEVWREEQAQMKLADANFILEDKYAEVNGLIADLKAFLTSSSSNSNVTSKAEILRQVFGLVITQGAKGFKHAIPESHNAFAASKSARTSEAKRKSGGHDQVRDCASDATREKWRPIRSSAGSLEDMTRGDDGEGSVNKMRRTPISNWNAEPNRNDCSVNTKGSSMMIYGSSDRSTARRNPHILRAMKGHIEWPWRMPRRGLAGGDLLEAKLESQKMLLRNVLRHKA